MKKLYKNKTFQFSLKLIVSVGFSAWVIYSVNWREVLIDVRKIELWQIGLYMAVLLVGIIISAYKWQIIARFKNINLPFKDFFNNYLAGTLINNFAPSFIGGDAYKTYQIGKQEKKYVEVASTVVFDRITGLLGATVLALFFALINIKTVLTNQILLIANVIVLISFAIDISIAVIKRFSFWYKLESYFPSAFVNFIKELNGYSINSSIFRDSFFLSLVFNIIGIALVNYILFWSLGIGVNMLDYLSVIFVISIISSIPISINNIGIKEWAYITLFGSLGLSSSGVVLVAILSRFLQMLVSLFALPVYLKGRDKIARIN